MPQSLRALIVEDEPLFAKVLEHVLRQWSFACFTASDAADARRCLDREQFDLILVDLKLPDDGGPALVMDLEQDPALRSRAMIVTSFPIMGKIFSALPVVEKTDLVAMRTAVGRFVTSMQSP